MTDSTIKQHLFGFIDLGSQIRRPTIIGMVIEHHGPVLQLDSACVFHNVSTRFSDGGEFGFGAEIGISTDKLHARGPMALRELTSYQYRIRGNGQVRSRQATT